MQRIDFIGDQLEEVSGELRELLEGFEETKYLLTLPGLSWVTAAALLAEIGSFSRFRHGRQLVKLAGLQPSRSESGETSGRTPIAKRGRAQLRAVVYMATLSALRNNPRIKAHYERLRQRSDKPLSKMHAFGACMNKLLLYIFAVVKNRQAFEVDHLWEAQRAAQSPEAPAPRRGGGHAPRCPEHFESKPARRQSAWHPPLLGNNVRMMLDGSAHKRATVRNSTSIGQSNGLGALTSQS